MGKGIRKPAATPDIARVSLSELIHEHVGVAIETAVHEERTWRSAPGPMSATSASRLSQRDEAADAHGPERAADAQRPARDALRGNVPASVESEN